MSCSILLDLERKLLDTYHPALVAEREEEGADEKREKDEPNDESQNDFAAHERP